MINHATRMAAVRLQAALGGTDGLEIQEAVVAALVGLGGSEATARRLQSPLAQTMYGFSLLIGHLPMMPSAALHFRQVRDNGWWSDDGGLTWNQPDGAETTAARVVNETVAVNATVFPTTAACAGQQLSQVVTFPAVPAADGEGSEP